MRPFYLLISLLCLFAFTACGTEEELIPPVFLTTEVNGAEVTTTPFKDPSVIITVTLDDVNATLVANSTATGEVPVIVSDDGIWRFTFAPLTAGANIISFTASDKRGNLNQMILTVNHDPTPPNVTAVVPSADPQNPTVPQLIVTFDETLLDTSLPTASFRVDNADGAIVANSLTTTPTTSNTVTLTLDAVLSMPGTYRLVYSGVADLAGNVATNFFDFTIE